MYKLMALLALSPVHAMGVSAQRDFDRASQLRHAEGQFGPRDTAGRLDRVPQARQLDPNNPPPITNTPICDEFDNYFYVTPRNYTWQLQCTTNYEGTVIQQIETEGYAQCIISCADYNRANGAGACIGINFNGPNDNVIGLCTQFSTVDNLLLADEEGNIQDSALLVYSPNGTVFATPRPNPSFSGQPAQAPTLVPLPSNTATDSTILVYTTSTITVTDCPNGALPCSLDPTSLPTSLPTSTGSVPTSTLIGTPVPPTFASSSSSGSTITIIDGGTRPGSSITSSPVTSITTIPSNSVGAQVTFTKVVTYTVYEVQAVVFCPATPGPCTQTTTTGSRVGLRTQLSCSPSSCAGIGTFTNAIADVAAATCIQTAS